MTEKLIVEATQTGGICISVHERTSSVHSIRLDSDEANTLLLKLLLMPQILPRHIEIETVEVTIDPPDCFDEPTLVHIEINGRSIPFHLDLRKLVAQADFAMAQVMDAYCNR